MFIPVLLPGLSPSSVSTTFIHYARAFPSWPSYMDCTETFPYWTVWGVAYMYVSSYCLLLRFCCWVIGSGMLHYLCCCLFLYIYMVNTTTSLSLCSYLTSLTICIPWYLYSCVLLLASYVIASFPSPFWVSR